MSLHRLLPLYDRARLANQALVLATVIRTGGSTYAKPGAQMLIAVDGEYAGLLSGGCLEGDLLEHSQGVFATGIARIVSYDLRSATDQLFGLGAGCEGAMDILLSRVDPEHQWEPLAQMAQSFRAGEAQCIAFVTGSRDGAFAPGLSFAVGVNGIGEDETPLAESGTEEAWQRLRTAAAAGAANTLIQVPLPDVQLFLAAVALPPRVLLLGGGPDARPVAELAIFLGWQVTVIEHRPAYLAPGRFPPATQLLDARAAQLAALLARSDFSAAIVMSHHLDSDLGYLRALAASDVPYVGLLGPAARREKLLADLGAAAAPLRHRLRAPVGLDIGGRTPESIALSIVGEVHAALCGRAGRPFTETAQ